MPDEMRDSLLVLMAMEDLAAHLRIAGITVETGRPARLLGFIARWAISRGATDFTSPMTEKGALDE